MSYTGLTVDSTTNGVDFIASHKTGLVATISGEVLQVAGGGKLMGTIAISYSQISLLNTPSTVNDSESVFSYGSSRFNTSDLLSIRNQSHILLLNPWNEARIFISELSDSAIAEENSMPSALVYSQANAILRSASFRGIKTLEFVAPPSVFSDVSLLNCGFGFLNWEAGRLDLIGINIPSTTSGYLGTIGQGATNNRIYLWNPAAYDFTKTLITESNGVAYLGYSVSWKFKDSNGAAVNDALVIYRDDRANIGGSKTELGRYTTNSSGILTGTYDSQLDTTGSNIARPSLWVRAKQTLQTGATVAQNPQVIYTFDNVGGIYTERPYTVQNVSTEIEFRSYLHLKPSLQGTPTEQIGKINSDKSINFYVDLIFIVDTGVTQTNTTTVSGYSGVAHAANLITLSGSLSLAQAYDSRKLYWRNNDNITAPLRVGQLADFGSTNLTIASGGTLTASTAKFSDGIKSNGTLTLLSPSSLTAFYQTDSGSIALQAAGNYSAIKGVVGATAIVTVVAGTTNLSGWTFASGATINRVSGSATVIVDSTTGITAGTGVTVMVAPSSIQVAVQGAPVGSAIGVFKSLGTGSIIADRAQFLLASGNNSGNSTLVLNATIPLDTPAAGFVRVVRASGVEDRLAYTSYAGSTFTLSGTLPAPYAAGDGAYVGYLDVLGSATGSESNTIQYIADRDCVLAVRKGSGTGRIKDLRQAFVIVNSSQVIPVSGILDSINNATV